MPLTHKQIRRIRDSGAQVGSVEALVGLTEADMEWIRLRESLAALLIETRQARGLSQSEFANTIDASQSAISRAEGADPSVSTDWLLRSLIAAGRTRDDIARVLTEGATARRAT